MTSREMFDQAIEVVLRHEGEELVRGEGWASKYGIDSRWNRGVDVEHLTREKAIEVYWERYWKQYGYCELPRNIAIKLFDAAVNMGHSAAVRCLQRALQCLENKEVEEDGILGPITIHSAGSGYVNSSWTLDRVFSSELAGHYRELVAKWPQEARYIAGWLNRAYE